MSCKTGLKEADALGDKIELNKAFKESFGCIYKIYKEK